MSLTKVIDFDGLEQRVRDFQALRLAGEPQPIEISTRLVGDLWDTVLDLKASASIVRKEIDPRLKHAFDLIREVVADADLRARERVIDGIRKMKEELRAERRGASVDQDTEQDKLGTKE